MRSPLAATTSYDDDTTHPSITIIIQSNYPPLAATNHRDGRKMSAQNPDLSSSSKVKDGGDGDENDHPSSPARLSVFGELTADTTTLAHDVENPNLSSAAGAAVDDTNQAAGGNDSVNFESFTRASRMIRPSMNSKVGILALMDDEVIEDEEKRNGNNTTTGETTIKGPRRAYVPFPSIIENSKHNFNDDDTTNENDFDEHDVGVNYKGNICPCRCIFFTLKESICLGMSALGCAVFFAGLIALCLFLEGSYVNGDQ
jgi:hypothetical protein